jgi:hypothetical protein
MTDHDFDVFYTNLQINPVKALRPNWLSFSKFKINDSGFAQNFEKSSRKGQSVREDRLLEKSKGQ